MRYKIKKRSEKHDNLPDGWYIYSRLYFPKVYKTGRAGFRRYLMSGPFSTRSAAIIRAGLMALKFNEFAEKIQKGSDLNTAAPDLAQKIMEVKNE